jgi:hypothetical protein
VSRLASALTLLLFLGPVVLVASGCAAIELQSPPQEVKAFFAAGQQADLLGILCLSPNSIDLSAYSQFMQVQYPPTDQVDVLNHLPSRPFKSFAVLQCETSSPSKPDELMEEFKSKAREIGADAIILCSLGPDRKIPALPPPGKLQAVAIKYILTDMSGQEHQP